MSSLPHPPPPKRLDRSVKPNLPYSSTLPPTNESFKEKSKRKGSQWGTTAVTKGITWSDKIGTKVNGWAEGYGFGERFWPVSGDFAEELAKCERILSAFVVDGVGVKVERDEIDPATGKKRRERKEVLRKIPAKVLREAQGIIIFSAMRNGIAPFGGSGGTGIIMARLEDGSWSAPSFISPNNLTVGLLLGCDFYDSVMVLRSKKAVEAFYPIGKVTLGAETAAAMGPYGAGASAESGFDRTPVYSYVRSRGLYAGIEILANAFLCRFDENERVYHWKGITQKDVLTGQTRAPREAEPLINLLESAELGLAQRAHGDAFEYEEPSELDTAVAGVTAELGDGETLKLPPTPDMLEQSEELEEFERRRLERDNQRYLR
ncbi:lipid-binding SYLF domain-containing protein [Sporobolomyces salmoneus]|uniref:lipid-binding SYLF domain-containing protein n=1 Tax=Sporobolomyces salmoneus TaxID=183962 RepID=UPI00317672BB